METLIDVDFTISITIRLQTLIQTHQSPSQCPTTCLLFLQFMFCMVLYALFTVHCLRYCALGNYKRSFLHGCFVSFLLHLFTNLFVRALRFDRV